MKSRILALPSRLLLLAFTAGPLATCAVNPVTGERQISLISEAQEIEIGRAAAQDVEQTIGLVDDGALQAYIQRIGEQLAAESERPDLPWTFRVADDPTPNAFALPGGFIYVTRGLMNLMDSEADLATVLGHEIGHVTARHSVTAISRAQLAQLGLGLGSVFFPQIQRFGGLAQTGLQLLFLQYGREAERQADDLGFGYALEQGYDVREMADVFATLQRVGEGGEGSALPSWLSTHPAPAERIESVEQRLATLEASPQQLRLGAAEYLGQIDGLVYGQDPRQGFFRNGVFYHPTLRFRVEFPAQWTGQNLPQAVIAVSPQEDAVVELTLAAEAGPEAAAQGFFGQQGIQAGQVSHENINGVPAVVGSFQAQTDQGLLQGWAGFLSHRGATYRILAYAPAARFELYDQTFRRMLGSFASVNDPQILGVRPNRLDLVRLEQSMSLTEFNRRYPSEVSIDELAIINQAADASQTFPAGSLLKRVIRGNQVLP